MRQTYKLISNVQNHFRGLQSTSENIVIDYQIDTKSSGGNIFGSIFHQIDYVNVAKSCFFQVPLGGASRVNNYLNKILFVVLFNYINNPENTHFLANSGLFFVDYINQLIDNQLVLDFERLQYSAGEQLDHLNQTGKEN